MQIRHAQNAVAREAARVAVVLFEQQRQHIAALIVDG